MKRQIQSKDHARHTGKRGESALQSLLMLLLCWVFTISSALAATEEVTYLHTDISGSPIAATNANGDVIWRETYQAYGKRSLNETASFHQNQWFHGKELDATGLQYFGARYYDPEIGRFMGIDPVGFQEENPHSFNRFAYGNNNPNKYLDPDGNNPALVQRVLMAVQTGASAAWSGAQGLYYRYAPAATEFVAGASGVNGTLVSPSSGYSAATAAAIASIPGQELTPVASGISRAVSSGAFSSGSSNTIKSGVSSVDAVIAETISGKGNISSAYHLNSTDLLSAGEKFLGDGYREIASGVFRSSDGLRQFRMDANSLLGRHAPGVPHGHLEVYAPGANKPKTNNHIPFSD